MCTGHSAHPLQSLQDVSIGFPNCPLLRAQLQQQMQDFLKEAFKFPVVKAGERGGLDLDVSFANRFLQFIYPLVN